MKHALKVHNITNENFCLQNEFQHPSLKLIYKNNKGCRCIYNHLIKNNTKPKHILSWTAELGLEEPITWKDVYSRQIGITKDTNLHWLQTRLMYKILGTNSLLFKMKISKNE